MRELFENKENSFLILNDLRLLRYIVTNPPSVPFGSSFPGNWTPQRSRSHDQAGITHQLVTTIRSFEELHQITKGQGWEGVMTEDVFRALSQGKEVQVMINQRAPERVNLLTPMVTAVMALLGGMGGAAYNDKLWQAIGEGSNKAADFVRKFGTNYKFGIGTGEHIDREVIFAVKDNKDEKKDIPPTEMKYNWKDWNYTTKPRPKPNNLTEVDNFDRREEIVEWEPPMEQPYVPPYLEPLIFTSDHQQPIAMSDIIGMRTFVNMTQKEGYSSRFSLNELKSAGILPQNTTEDDMKNFVDRFNSFLREHNIGFELKKQGNDYVLLDQNGREVTKESFTSRFLDSRYPGAVYGTNTSRGNITITSRVVGDTDLPKTYHSSNSKGKAQAVADYSRMAMTYGAFDFSNPDDAFFIPEGGTIQTNRPEKWAKANQTFQKIENNIIDKPIQQLSTRDKKLKEAYDNAFQEAYQKYKSIGLSDNVAKSRAKAEGILAIGNELLNQGRFEEAGEVFAAMVLKAEDHSGTYNGHIGAGHIGDIQGNNTSELNEKRRVKQEGPAGGQQNFIPEANIYVDGCRAVSKLISGQNLDTEEENGFKNLVDRYNALTGANLTVEQLKSDIASGNFSKVTEVLKFARASLNLMKDTLRSTGYETAHPNLAFLSMQLNEANGIMSQIDSLILYTENPPVSNLDNSEIVSVNEYSRAASIISKIARGDQITNDEKAFIESYTGKKIEDLNNPDVLIEELSKIKTKLSEVVSKLPENYKHSVENLISNIDNFTSEVSKNRDKLGKSSLKQKLDRIFDKLSEYDDKTILSDKSIDRLKSDIKNMDKLLQEELKKAGVDISKYLKQDGTLDLDKLIAENKVPEHLKDQVSKFKAISDKANFIIQNSIGSKNVINEYNEVIAEDENFTPELRDKLLSSGLDISALKNSKGELDSKKVFQFAIIMDQLRTGEIKIENVPKEFRSLVSSLNSKPELKTDLEELGMNLRVYQKDRTKEQEFTEIFSRYPGIMDGKHAYNNLGYKDKDKSIQNDELTGMYASGLDVYGILPNQNLKQSVKALHSKGKIDETDPDYKKVFNSVDGRVLFKNGKLTPEGQMTRDFLKIAVEAGIITQSELDSALSSEDGKKLAQLFLKTELELHNRYGLKIDGQLGAEHMTDITHVLRDKAQEYTTIANLFMDFYYTGSIQPSLVDLISKNKQLFIGKKYGGVEFDPNNVERFLQNILLNKNGAREFLETVKSGLEGIKKEIQNNNFIKTYGQAMELSDDIDFVITGTKQRDGRVLEQKPDSGIEAFIKYVNETNGVGINELKEMDTLGYARQISDMLDNISSLPNDVPIKLGDKQFKNKEEVLKFLYQEYQKVLLSGFDIKDPALRPEAMADKFTNAFTSASKTYDDIRETFSLLMEANNKKMEFSNTSSSINNNYDKIIEKQINALPKDGLNQDSVKKIQDSMKDVLNNPGNKTKVDKLLEAMKEAFANLPNDTRSEEIVKVYLAMAEKVIKKSESKGPADPPDFTGLFVQARTTQTNGGLMNINDALNFAIEEGKKQLFVVASR